MERPAISRRTFLQGLSLLPATLLLNRCSFVQSQKTEITKEDLENEFRRVRLLTKNEYDIENNFPLNSNSTVFNTPWAQYDLRILRDTLRIIPEQMHFPSIGSNPTTFVIYSRGTDRIQGEGECACTPPNVAGYFDVENYKPYIFLNYRTNNRPLDAELTVHELTHNRTQQIIPEINPAPYVPISSPDLLLRNIWPWHLAINSILGEEYQKKRRNINAYCNKKTAEALDEIQMFFDQKHEPLWMVDDDISALTGLDPLILDNFFFYTYLNYATAYREPHELIAVLAQKFLHGREYFVRRLGEIFSPDRLLKNGVPEALYAFIQENVFLGHPGYEKFPII